MRLALIVLLAGCPAGSGDDDGPADAPSAKDGPVGSDSAPGAARLTIAWATTPVVPGPTPMLHRIDDVRLRMENFKAFVDVDPNDPNTTQAELELHWSASEGPAPMTFTNATPGQYNSIVLKLDEGNGQDAFRITGESNDNDSFRFDDKTSVPVQINCNFALAPGEDKTVTIDIDLATAVDLIDIEELESGGGVDHHLEDDDESEAMMQFRTALQSAFSVRE